MHATDLPPITALVPHRSPMCLIDRLVTGDAHRACGELTIRPDHPLLRGATVPAVAALEYIAQTIAAHVGLRSHLRGEPPRRGFLIGCRNLDLHAATFPCGVRLTIDVEQTWTDGAEAALYRGRVRLTDRLVAEGTLTVYQGELRED